MIATASADPNQRRLMLLLPVVFVAILYRYPAGLLVYWITTNTWTIGQQYLIKRHMPPPPKVEAPPKTEANGKPSSPLRAALAGALGTPSATQPDPKPAIAGPPPSSRKKKKRSGRRR